MDWGPTAADYVGQRSEAASTTVQVNANQPPPPPPDAQNVGLVTLTSTTIGTIHASWEAPAEEPATYEVSWQRTEGTYPAMSTFSTLLSYSLSGLEIDTEYGVMVRAQYDDTVGEWSDESFVTVSSSFTTVPEVNLDRRTYSWTDRVYITVISPDNNFDDTQIDEIGDTDDYQISVATRNYEIEQYNLVETDTSTGIFTGEITLTGFDHDLDGDGIFDTTSRGKSGSGPTDGLLESFDDDGIAVTFWYPDDGVVISSSTIRWNIGEIQWLEASHPGTGTGVIRVIDQDMNLDPDAADDFEVSVWSDTHTGGIDLTVTETDLTTGIFEGTVSFSLDDETGRSNLAVSGGDTVTAEYTDYTLPSPYYRTESLNLSATALIDMSVPPPDVPVPEPVPEPEPEPVPEPEPEPVPEPNRCQSRNLD